MINEVAPQVEETDVKKKPKLSARLKGFFEDFARFINKGNIVNLAVALVIGSAFTKIINSFVNDMIMPLFSMIFGETALTDMTFQITDSIEIRWGSFLMAVIEFLIIAFCIFIVLRIAVNSQRGITRLAKKQLKALKKMTDEEKSALPPPPAPEPAKIESTEDILRDIRRLLARTEPENTPAENKAE